MVSVSAESGRVRVLIYPVLPRLVALIRPRLLHLAVELDLLFIADLRQWDVANIEHPVSLRRKDSCEEVVIRSRKSVLVLV